MSKQQHDYTAQINLELLVTTTVSLVDDEPVGNLISVKINDLDILPALSVDDCRYIKQLVQNGWNGKDKKES